MSELTISSDSARISTPYRDPSSGLVMFVPIDVEVQIIRAWLTPARVRAAMNAVPNLAIEAYEPTISEFAAALRDEGEAP